MNAERFPKMDDEDVDYNFSLSPERLSAVGGSAAPAESLVDTAHRGSGNSGWDFSPRTVEEEPLELDRVVRIRKQRGKPADSGDIYIRPVFKKPPDLEKIGRAVIALAAKTKKETGGTKA